MKLENCAKTLLSNLLTYLLALAALVLLILKLAMPKQAKVLNLIAAFLLILAGVFFFLTNQFTIFAGENAARIYSLAAGPIVAGILSIVAPCTAGAEMFIAD